jgi:hypothetical protein
MKKLQRFYTYAYLRKNRTPYYIGKGEGYRAYNKNHNQIFVPPKNRIIFLKKNILEEDAFKHEIYMIAVFGRKDLGTGILHNKTNGGDGASGRVPTENQKRKQSEKMKGRKKLHTISEEGRKKLSEIMKGNKRGKPHTEETKKKISLGHKGKKLTENHKKKLSDAHKGVKRQPHSEETKIKISKIHKKNGLLPPSHKGTKWWNNGQINKRSIECPGIEWNLGKTIKCQ